MQRKSVVDSGVQTYICVVPFFVENDTIVNVRCTRGTQSIAKLINATLDTVVTELEYLPFDEIKENCEKIIDLPKKTVLQFRLPHEIEEDNVSRITVKMVYSNDKISLTEKNGNNNTHPPQQNSNIPNTSQSDNNDSVILKSNIKKESGASIYHHVMTSKTFSDVAIQTNIGVAPHILDEDEVAQVSTSLAIQTSITFDPLDAGPSIGKRLKTKLAHAKNDDIVIDIDKPRVVDDNEENIDADSETSLNQKSKADIANSETNVTPSKLDHVEEPADTDINDNENTENLDNAISDLESDKMQETGSELEPTDALPTSDSEFEARIKYVMNTTVQILEAQLERMIREYDTSKKREPEMDPVNNQSSTMAEQTNMPALTPAGCYSGDSKHVKSPPRIECECQVGGESGAAVPKLEGVRFDVIVNKELPASNNKTNALLLQATLSIHEMKPTNPDLCEQAIRLPIMRPTTPQLCHCAKSDSILHENFNHNYRLKSTIPNMAHNNCQCGKITGANPNSTNLYQQDGEYADSYLDLLSQDNEGTQTEVCLSIGSQSLDSLGAMKCRCTANIEIPWDDITYRKHNRPHSPCPPPPEPVIIIKELPPPPPVIPPPPKDKLKQLTVAEMDSAELRHLTSKFIGQESVSDAHIKDVEYQLLKLRSEDAFGSSREMTTTSEHTPIIKNNYGAYLGNISVVNDSRYNPSPKPSPTLIKQSSSHVHMKDFPDDVSNQYVNKKQDVVKQSPSIKKDTHARVAKRIPELVFDPSCERSNEPYMDKMYKYFPDECDDPDICDSHTEIPWNNIVLPKICNIRKVYKHNPTEKKMSAKGGGNAKANKSRNAFDIQISFAEITSNLIRVENSAAMQKTLSTTTTLTDLRYKPKRIVKDFIINATSSQPFIPALGHVKKNVTPSKLSATNSRESTFIGSINMNGCAQKPSNKSINKPYSSMPQITSKQSLRKHAPRVPIKENTDRIAGLVESCNKEMKPIQDGINKLRERIRELNIPTISQNQGTRPYQYREMKTKITIPTPGGSYGPAMPSYTSMYRPQPPTNLPYPPYPPLYPFCPYHLPQCFHSPPERYRRNNRSKTPRRERSPSKSSSQGSAFSDIDSPGTPITCPIKKPKKVTEPKINKDASSCTCIAEKNNVPKIVCDVKLSKQINQKPSKTTKPSKIPIKCPVPKSYDESQTPSVIVKSDVTGETQSLHVSIAPTTSKVSCATAPSYISCKQDPTTPSCQKQLEIKPDPTQSLVTTHSIQTQPESSTPKKITVHSKIRMNLPPSSKFRPVTSEKSISTNSSKETCTDGECK